MSNAVVVDAGTGNLHSVLNALVSQGWAVSVTRSAAEVRQAQRLILPGVGAFQPFMAGLAASGLAEAIIEQARRGVPLLGICVGMQALLEGSAEMGFSAGLGLVQGKVTRLVGEGIKIPHTGWNQIWRQQENPLFQGLPDGFFAYFNHSYACQPATAGDIAALTDYGQPFCSVLHADNIYGVQFHPEKSQTAGLQILRNFMTYG